MQLADKFFADAPAVRDQVRSPNPAAPVRFTVPPLMVRPEGLEMTVRSLAPGEPNS